MRYFAPHLEAYKRRIGQIDKYLGTYVNAIFTLEVNDGKVSQDADGNYTPNTLNMLKIKAMIDSTSVPNQLLQEGVNINNKYYKGKLVSPKVHPNLPQSCDCKIKINGVFREGKFNFVKSGNGAFAEETNSTQATGQNIEGWFVEKAVKPVPTL